MLTVVFLGDGEKTKSFGEDGFGREVMRKDVRKVDGRYHSTRLL